MKHSDQFEKAKQEAQKLADLYHRPYYVVRGRIGYWTVSPWQRQRGRSYEVYPADGKVDLLYI